LSHQLSQAWVSGCDCRRHTQQRITPKRHQHEQPASKVHGTHQQAHGIHQGAQERRWVVRRRRRGPPSPHSLVQAPHSCHPEGSHPVLGVRFPVEARTVLHSQASSGGVQVLCVCSTVTSRVRDLLGVPVAIPRSNFSVQRRCVSTACRNLTLLMLSNSTPHLHSCVTFVHNWTCHMCRSEGYNEQRTTGIMVYCCASSARFCIQRVECALSRMYKA
jgi:hypothetical protein